MIWDHNININNTNLLNEKSLGLCNIWSNITFRFWKWFWLFDSFNMCWKCITFNIVFKRKSIFIRVYQHNHNNYNDFKCNDFINSINVFSCRLFISISYEYMVDMFYEYNSCNSDKFKDWCFYNLWNNFISYN